MKKAVLLVSFGTSHKDAQKSSLDKIAEDLSQVCEKTPVIQAYTSGMIIKKLAAQGVKVYTVEEAFYEAVLAGAEEVYVIATHMIPGIEYQKMKSILHACANKYKSPIKKVKIAEPVLAEVKDCEELVPVLREVYAFGDDCEYILMGHGTEAAANVRYAQMEEALQKAGFENVHMASVEAKPDLEDVISLMGKKQGIGKVLVWPFMIVAGDHAKNDMAGAENSYVTRLKKEGYDAEAVVKGLGEYPRFREIFAGKLKELMK